LITWENNPVEALVKCGNTIATPIIVATRVLHHPSEVVGESLTESLMTCTVLGWFDHLVCIMGILMGTQRLGPCLTTRPII
jgi:hypothetical protein